MYCHQTTHFSYKSTLLQIYIKILQIQPICNIFYNITKNIHTDVKKPPELLPAALVIISDVLYPTDVLKWQLRG